MWITIRFCILDWLQKFPQLQVLGHQLIVKLVQNLFAQRVFRSEDRLRIKRPAYAHAMYARGEHIAFRKVHPVSARNADVPAVYRNPLSDAIGGYESYRAQHTNPVCAR